MKNEGSKYCTEKTKKEGSKHVAETRSPGIYLLSCVVKILGDMKKYCMYIYLYNNLVSLPSIFRFFLFFFRFLPSSIAKSVLLVREKKEKRKKKKALLEYELVISFTRFLY
ncbi:hypothetical protein I3843_01G219300 [Carya illinoinensis]|nr:hypothetical protein I3843_01G219300 [Carya illinoinensis]